MTRKSVKLFAGVTILLFSVFASPVTAESVADCCARRLAFCDDFCGDRDIAFASCWANGRGGCTSTCGCVPSV